MLNFPSPFLHEVLGLIICNDLQFIRALDPEQHPDNFPTWKNLFYSSILWVSMAENRASRAFVDHGWRS